MSITLSISREAEAKLQHKATAAGVDLSTFASQTLERAAMRPSLDEILQPLRDEFDRQGMSEEELTHFLEGVKHGVRAEWSAS